MRARLVAAFQKQLRCIVCRRAPTPEEAEEMYESFGHKTTLSEVPDLVWRCLSCKSKTGAS